MNDKDCRRKRMDILKRKRLNNTLPEYRRRKVARTLDMPLRWPFRPAIENMNRNYTSPFEDSMTERGSSSRSCCRDSGGLDNIDHISPFQGSVTERGSSSRSTVITNRPPLTVVTDSQRTVEDTPTFGVNDDSVITLANVMTQQSVSNFNPGITANQGRHKSKATTSVIYILT